MEEKTMYNMELGQEISLGPICVVRVPGGWVFQNQIGGACFVPFDNEFQTNTPELLEDTPMTEKRILRKEWIGTPVEALVKKWEHIESAGVNPRDEVKEAYNYFTVPAPPAPSEEIRKKYPGTWEIAYMLDVTGEKTNFITSTGSLGNVWLMTKWDDFELHGNFRYVYTGEKERCKECQNRMVVDCPSGCNDGWLPCPTCQKPEEVDPASQDCTGKSGSEVSHA